MSDDGVLLLGSITISDYIDTDGHHAYAVDVTGDLEVANILGLLELGKNDVLTNMLEDFELETDEEDE